MAESVPRLKSLGNSSLARLALAQALIQHGHDEDAREEVRAALAANPELAGAHFLSGTLLLRQDRWDEAAQDFRRCVAIDATNVEAWLGLAQCHHKRERYDAALSAVDRALRLEGEDADKLRAPAHLQRGQILVALGRYDQAVTAFRKSLAADPSLARAQYEIGNCLYRAGRLPPAREALGRAVQMPTADPQWRVLLGDVLRDEQQWHQAIHEYRQVIHALPWAKEPHARLGAAYLELHMYQEALIELRLATLLDPVRAENYLLQARTYLALNCPDQAVEMSRAALAHEPGNAAAADMLATSRQAAHARLSAPTNAVSPAPARGIAATNAPIPLAESPPISPSNS